MDGWGGGMVMGGGDAYMGLLVIDDSSAFETTPCLYCNAPSPARLCVCDADLNLYQLPALAWDI